MLDGVATRLEERAAMNFGLVAALMDVSGAGDTLPDSSYEALGVGRGDIAALIDGDTMGLSASGRMALIGSGSFFDTQMPTTASLGKASNSSMLGAFGESITDAGNKIAFVHAPLGTAVAGLGALLQIAGQIPEVKQKLQSLEDTIAKRLSEYASAKGSDALIKKIPHMDDVSMRNMLAEVIEVGFKVAISRWTS
jgi:hypothetical protein